MADYTTRNAIPAAQIPRDDGGLNALRAKLLMQQSAQQPAYVMPGEPAAKAFAPVLAQVGALMAGKAASKQEQEKQQRLAKMLTGLAQGKEVPGQMPEGQMGPAQSTYTPYTEKEKISQLANNPDTQELALKLLFPQQYRPQNTPSDIQITDRLMDPNTPEEYKKTLRGVIRANQVVNTGGTQTILDPMGGVSSVLPVTLKPGETPAVRGAQAQATKAGTAAGEQEASLVEMQANLPRLEVVVGQLAKLGKTATYTKAGQALDASRRELGLDSRKEAIARKEYISKVDNEVLPLLRETFGAAFTQKEGESLKATLGDPDSSPAEKDAVLRSFIDSKRAQVETQRRKVQASGTPTGNNQPAQTSPNIDELLKKY